MKCHVPEISWHNRDPVLSVDIQWSEGDVRRMATGGQDSHVLVWSVSTAGNIGVECVADLSRHTKPVNIVRFSPSGEILASGDDEAALILWKQQEKEQPDIFVEEEVQNKEHWGVFKMLRGHIEDICDLSWAPESNYIISGSVDNSAILWDVQKGKNIGLLSEHKGFVQGVSWDPLNQYLATLGSDRTLRIYNIQTKRVVYKIQKTLLPSEESQDENKPTRIFYDDTLKSFSRRLTFSPDGELLIVPTGILEQEDGKFSNAVYIFCRHSLNRPVMYLPTGKKFTLAVRCCPVLFELRKRRKNGVLPPETEQESLEKDTLSVFSLPYRVVFAVATQDSLLLYDTQQTLPFAKISNIHFTRLSDLAWSVDGLMLIASSTDGYCSFIRFSEGELGVPYQKPHLSTGDSANFKESIETSATCSSAKTDVTALPTLEGKTSPNLVSSEQNFTVKCVGETSANQDVSGNVTESLIPSVAQSDFTKTQNSPKITVALESSSSVQKGQEPMDFAPSKEIQSIRASESVSSEPQSFQTRQQGEKPPRRVQLITLARPANKP
ncbi:chromatin assembly factor 1, p105 subunit [Tachypleus tridentatus]|uniref:chromatin assembly factor 1, p105 subunit n=1 Tax=Tachypleus tridentatus TaxID=6853 RepID=UPI003FCF2D64